MNQYLYPLKHIFSGIKYRTYSKKSVDFLLKEALQLVSERKKPIKLIILALFDPVFFWIKDRNVTTYSDTFDVEAHISLLGKGLRQLRDANGEDFEVLYTLPEICDVFSFNKFMHGIKTFSREQEQLINSCRKLAYLAKIEIGKQLCKYSDFIRTVDISRFRSDSLSSKVMMDIVKDKDLNIPIPPKELFNTGRRLKKDTYVARRFCEWLLQKYRIRQSKSGKIEKSLSSPRKSLLKPSFQKGHKVQELRKKAAWRDSTSGTTRSHLSKLAPGQQPKCSRSKTNNIQVTIHQPVIKQPVVAQPITNQPVVAQPVTIQPKQVNLAATGAIPKVRKQTEQREHPYTSKQTIAAMKGKQKHRVYNGCK